MHKGCTVCFLITLFGFLHDSKHLQKCLGEPSNLYILHWVVGCSLEFSTLAILHSSLIKLASKHWPWSLVYTCWEAIIYNKLSNNTLETFLAVCFLVGMACAYPIIGSVMTRMLSTPPFEGSRDR